MVRGNPNEHGARSWIIGCAEHLCGNERSHSAARPRRALSPERLALIDAFKQQAEGLDNKFEPRTHKGDWVMPYRLFRPEATGRLPLVMYLHGSGGLGDDNVKQMGLGNIFGTRVWVLPENQTWFPSCRRSTNRPRMGARPVPQRAKTAEVVPGLGDGGEWRRGDRRVARRIHPPIDEHRIYIMGQ